MNEHEDILAGIKRLSDDLDSPDLKVASAARLRIAQIGREIDAEAAAKEKGREAREITARMTALQNEYTALARRLADLPRT